MQNSSILKQGNEPLRTTQSSSLTTQKPVDYTISEIDRGILLHEFNMAGLPDGDPIKIIEREISNSSADAEIFNKLLLNLKYSVTKDEKIKIAKLIVKALG